MPFYKKQVALIATALCGMSVITACGGSSGASAPASKSTTAQSSGAAAGSSSSSAAPASMQTVKLVLGWTPQGWMAPYAYGVEEGIFKKYGIDLKLSPGTGLVTTVEATAKGEFDFGLADGTTAVALASKGIKTVTVFGYVQGSAVDLVIAKSSGVTTPQQLEGKALAVTPTTDTYALLAPYLKAENIPAGSVKLDDLGGPQRIPAIIAGRAVGEIGIGTIEDGPTLEGKGVPVTYFELSQAGINAYESESLVANPSVVQNNPTLVTNMVKAIRESIQGTEQNPNQAITDLQKLFPSQTPAASVMLEQWKNTIPLLQTPQDAGHQLGWISPADWTTLVKVATDYEKVNMGSLDPSTIYTDQFVQ